VVDIDRKRWRHVDVVWSLAKIPYGATLNQNPRTFTNYFVGMELTEYQKFSERNTGSLFAVRQSLATHRWLNDALSIRANQSHGKYKTQFREFNDQAALREAYFIHRHSLREHLIPPSLACREPFPFRHACTTCMCVCSSCGVVHGKKHFDKCSVFANTTEK